MFFLSVFFIYHFKLDYVAARVLRGDLRNRAPCHSTRWGKPGVLNGLSAEVYASISKRELREMLRTLNIFLDWKCLTV